MPKKSTLLFFLVVMISFIMMTYQGHSGYLLQNDFLKGLLNSSNMAADSLIDDVQKPFQKLVRHQEENTRLKNRIGALLRERENYQEIILENRRLKELLEIREAQRNYVTTARVIGQGSDRWAQTMLLNKGAKDGIVKDMTAITPRGIAGKILTVSDTYSRLLLLTDITFSVSVRLEESRHEGVLSGTGSKKCILKYIPYGEPVRVGDIVITSGLDALFPPGIPAGYVSGVGADDKGGDFQYIEVIPFQDNSKLEEVIIVR